MRSDIYLSPEAGQVILPVESFSIEMVNDSLARCTVKLNSSETEDYDFLICLHSEGVANE